MRLPLPRGPLSAALFTDLQSGVVRPGTVSRATSLARTTADSLTDEDLQVSIYALYELHYTGLAGVADDAESDPDALRVRRTLEAAFERDLRAAVPAVDDDGGPVDLALESVIGALDGGPSVSRYLSREGDEEQWREFLMQKSLYHLKEADPHTWVIPRLSGRAKAALVEIQGDEYGGGSVSRMHSALFARMMRELGLDDTYGAYVDVVPAPALAATNVMSLFGLSRRWRGAAVGHLCGVEMTSTEACRRLAAGLRRLRVPAPAVLYYDEHVEADAVHEQLASKDLAGSLVATEPGLRADLLFGTAAYLTLESRMGAALLAEWSANRSSLRAQGDVAA